MSTICFILCWQPCLIELSVFQLWEIRFSLCFAANKKGGLYSLSRNSSLLISFIFQNDPSSDFTQLWANEKKSLISDFHRSSFKIVGLHIFGISDDSTETTKSY